jgi:hypothetical protein
VISRILTLPVVAAALAALCLAASAGGRERLPAAGPEGSADSYWGSYRSCSDPGFDLGVTDSLADCEWWLASTFPQAGQTRYGIDAPAVWPVSQGAGVMVAVVDTGVAPHVDYGPNLLAGYNFWAPTPSIPRVTAPWSRGSSRRRKETGALSVLRRGRTSFQ